VDTVERLDDGGLKTEVYYWTTLIATSGNISGTKEGC
jgi:hypothetical protein